MALSLFGLKMKYNSALLMLLLRLRLYFVFGDGGGGGGGEAEIKALFGISALSRLTRLHRRALAFYSPFYPSLKYF